MNVYEFETGETYWIVANRFAEACSIFFEDCEDEEMLKEGGGFKVKLLLEEEVDNLTVMNTDVKGHPEITMRQVINETEGPGLVASSIC